MVTQPSVVLKQVFERVVWVRIVRNEDTTDVDVFLSTTKGILLFFGRTSGYQFCYVLERGLFFSILSAEISARKKLMFRNTRAVNTDIIGCKTGDLSSFILCKNTSFF
jgi:hypothetical protein